MRGPSKKTLASAFLVFILLAAVLLLATVYIADTSPVRVREFRSTVHDDHTIRVSLQQASPGDVVVLRYDHHAGHPVSHYDFLVTEDEDAQRLEKGEPPREQYVYFREQGITADNCCHRSPLQITRSEPPPGEQRDTIALVWIYWHAADVPAPTDDESREALGRSVIQATFGTDTPETIPAYAVFTNRILSALMVVSVAGAGVAGVMWFVQGNPRILTPARGKETEALVSLVRSGHNLLRMIRAITAVALVFLIVTGVMLLTTFFVYLEDFVPPPTATWNLFVQVTTLGIWGLVVSACIVILVRIHKTIRLWDHYTERDPLEP